jgi:hypothetical protein
MSAGAPTIHPEVHPSNAKTLAAWDGDEGDYWVENEAVFDASLGRYRRRYFEVAAVSAGDRVLDIGCGTARRPVTRPGSPPKGWPWELTCRQG